MRSTHFFFRLFTPGISNRERSKHTYIVGGTGSGKSEVLKNLIYDTILRSKEAVVLLDPKGDLARETAQFIEHTLPGRKDKLVYISPFDFPGFTPVLNPLQLPPAPPTQYEKLVDITTRELTTTLNNIFSEMDTSGGGFTGMMMSVLAPCIETLIRKGDADFWDLMVFMDDSQNEHLVALGRQSPNESVRRFFLYDFSNVPFTTRDGIRWRTRNLLNSQVFAKFTTGESTIDLKKFIDERKCIIFNLDTGSMSRSVSSHIGKFIVSLLQVMAMQRGGLPDHQKVPVHLFIDEFHNYTTLSIKHILAESRSNKLFLTIAQQLVGQDAPDKNFKRILMGNTNIKILGKSSTNENYKDLSDEFGIPVEQLQHLPEFYFYVKVGNGAAWRVKGRSGLVRGKNAMSAAMWEQVYKEQLSKYYVPEMKAIKEKRQQEETRMAAKSVATDENTDERKSQADGKQLKAGSRKKKRSDAPPEGEPPFPFS